MEQDHIFVEEAQESESFLADDMRYAVACHEAGDIVWKRYYEQCHAIGAVPSFPRD